MTVEKPKPKQLLPPITTGRNSSMDQSQFLAITCNSLKAREKSRAIGFGFASHWLKNWRDSFKPITKRSNRNPLIILLSTVTWKLLYINAFLVRCYGPVLFFPRLTPVARTSSPASRSASIPCDCEHNYFGFDVYWPIKQHFSLSEDFHSKTRDAIEWGPLIYGINGLVYFIWLRTNQMLCGIRYNLSEQYLTGPEF